jgi:hypothetical protein
MRYKGKKPRLVIGQNWLMHEYTFAHDAWVENTDADKLKTANPRMFEILGARGDTLPQFVAPAVAEIVEEKVVVPTVAPPIQDVEIARAINMVEINAMEKDFADMDKDELEAYAKKKFGVDLDKRKSFANLLLEVEDLVGAE